MKVLLYNGRRAEAMELEAWAGCLIGRDPQKVDLVVNDRYVSDIHATLEVTKKGVFLIDKGSRNGFRSRVGRALGSRVFMKPGRRVYIGEHAIEIIPDAKFESSTEPLPPSFIGAFAVALIAAMFMIFSTVLGEYLRAEQDWNLLWSIYSASFDVGAILFIALGCYVLGKILRGRGYFWPVAALLATASVLENWNQITVAWVEYNVGSSLLVSLLPLLFSVVLSGLVVFYLVRWSSHWSSQVGLLFSALAVCCVLFQYWVFASSETDYQAKQATYNPVILPEALRIAPAKQAEAWVEDSSSLFDKAAANTKEDEG